MKGECSMTALEASRLIDWLKAHGHTDADATECIKCIAGVLDPQAEEDYQMHVVKGYTKRQLGSKEVWCDKNGVAVKEVGFSV